MSCDLAHSLLHSYFDGELSTLDAVEFGRHVEHCADCGTTLVNLDLLSGTLRTARLYAPAPASLLREVRGKLSAAPLLRAVSRPLLWHWFAAAAALLLLAIAAWKVNSNFGNDDYQSELASEIVQLHIRALHEGFSAGITSHDQRAVKEWVQHNLRFALPVYDFSNDGFALRGGRVDVVDGRPMAALVYVHAGRFIDVFVWPTRKPDSSPLEGSRQGYQWVDWRKGKMEFCAVSDMDPADLRRLHLLIDSSDS